MGRDAVERGAGSGVGGAPMTIGQGPRGFDPYFDAQQGNLDHMRRLPHFYALVEPVNTLY